MSTVFGSLRIKNEAKWIERVILAMLPVCERIFVFDDSSDDHTCELVRRMDEKVTLIHSPFTGLDESRDREFILSRVMGCVSDFHLQGNPRSPFWNLSIDGDEVLEAAAAEKIHASLAMADVHGIHAFKLPILYAWDREDQIRVDGVYRTFARPSLFRLMNKAFRFQRTPWGAKQPDGSNANFHCSSIPQELLHHAQTAPICPAKVLHLGYLDAELRRRKFEWYSRIDPNNEAEGRYLHCVQGDEGGPPADVRLKHAGPLELVPLSSLL